MDQMNSDQEAEQQNKAADADEATKGSKGAGLTPGKLELTPELATEYAKIYEHAFGPDGGDPAIGAEKNWMLWAIMEPAPGKKPGKKTCLRHSKSLRPIRDKRWRPQAG